MIWCRWCISIGKYLWLWPNLQHFASQLVAPLAPTKAPPQAPKPNATPHPCRGGGRCRCCGLVVFKPIVCGTTKQWSWYCHHGGRSKWCWSQHKYGSCFWKFTRPCKCRDCSGYPWASCHACLSKEDTSKFKPCGVCCWQCGEETVFGDGRNSIHWLLPRGKTPGIRPWCGGLQSWEDQWWQARKASRSCLA